MDRNRTWMDKPIARVIQHLVFWVLSFYVFLRVFKIGAEPEKIDYVYTALFHLTLLPAVYINLQILLPAVGKKKKWWWNILAVIILIVLFSWINQEFFDDWSKHLLPDYFLISYFGWWEIVIFFVVYIGITSLLKLSKSWFTVNDLQRKLLETEKEKVDMELSALKSQINPHFFFNTLNSIYSMSLEKDERLPSTVLQLSDMMRYFLYESREDFVPLDKEIKVLQDYISLQKIRSTENLDLETAINEVSGRHKIAPFLLITFVENAFKHGAKGSTGGAFIRIALQVDAAVLNFKIENNKGWVDEVESGSHKGLGLENVKRRLELLYPSKHELKITDNVDRFIVNLHLQL